jgi:hypothetical protein
MDDSLYSRAQAIAIGAQFETELLNRAMVNALFPKELVVC